MLKTQLRTFGLALAIAPFSTPAPAAELTLNDLPTILNVLRECQSVEGWLRPSKQQCRLDDGEVWAAVGVNLGIIIFYKPNRDGIAINGSGATLNEALQNLANKLNATQSGAKRAVDLLGPFLPSQ